MSEGYDKASHLATVIGSSALFRSSEMSEPMIEIGSLTGHSSQKKPKEPAYEWAPTEVFETVQCEPGRAYDVRDCLYVKNVLDPQRGTYNRYARLHVQ
mmetsp:Transcript_37137/g.48836  ORF Transcript_37137/g.48836 Transcript_37137/m.48836 type:complete len:98 (+) Transcript_37137:2031-2324(+)